MVPLEQLVLGARTFDGEKWANDTAVNLTIKKLRSKDCYVVDSLFFAGSAFLRRAPTERYFLVPVHIENHWALYYWDTKSTIVEYHDSIQDGTLPCKDRLLSIIENVFRPATMPEIRVCEVGHPPTFSRGRS